jgi:hypothetical protein
MIKVMEKNNENLTFEKMQELSKWKDMYDELRQYVSIERFVKQAKANGYDDSNAEKLYSIFSAGYFKNLRLIESELNGKFAKYFPEALNIAKVAYDNIHNSVTLHRRSYEEPADIRRYYFEKKVEGQEGEMEEVDVNLSESSDILVLADILRNRTDLKYVGHSKFCEEIETDSRDRKKIKIFEGDIIFVHHDLHDHMFSLYKVKEKAGVYICEREGCYVKLRYMQDSGYVDEDGNLNKSDKRCNHYGITGIADAQHFDVIGNIYKDISVLMDNEIQEESED